jgi:tripartite-type tricarboxylate transporter receptor subunit TctC
MPKIVSRRFLLAVAILVGGFFSVSETRAQIGCAPVRIVFPFGAGGSGDALARILGEHLREGINRSVIIENKSGAAGRLGVESVVKAAPDGDTILITPIAPISIYPHVYDKLSYDPFKDLEPLAHVADFEFALAVGPQVPAKNLKELVEWLKANPNAANYGTPGAGTLPHFFAVSFKNATGIDLRHVGYRGSAPALTDLIGGQITMVFTTTADLLETHNAGRIRILATSDDKRSPLLPDVPTFKQEGYDIVGKAWYAMYVPAKTPRETITRLNKIIADAVRRPDVKERLLKLGLYATGSSPDELMKIQMSDSELWKPTIAASGFKAQQ